MDRSRRRVAIGVYATADDAATTMGRLQALGIAHYQCLPLPPDQAASALIASRPAKPADTSSSGPVMVRIYLRSPADEQVVVAALLESPAISVQLHDIDPPGAD